MKGQSCGSAARLRPNGTHLRIEPPESAASVESAARKDENERGEGNENDGIPDEQLFRPRKRKVEPKTEPPEEKEQTWQLQFSVSKTARCSKKEKPAHLRQLPPVQMMPGVELEDEDIVDLRLRPQPTGETEK